MLYADKLNTIAQLKDEIVQKLPQDIVMGNFIKTSVGARDVVIRLISIIIMFHVNIWQEISRLHDEPMRSILN